MKQQVGALLEQYNECLNRGLYSEAAWLMDFIKSSCHGSTALNCASTANHSLALTEAKLCFDRKQYRRAAAVLEAETDATSMFLRLHSLLIAAELDGQARRGQEPADFIDYQAPIGLPELLQDCKNAMRKHKSDPYLPIMMSKILKAMGMESNEVLLGALKEHTDNWAVWSNLQEYDERNGLPSTSLWYQFYMIRSLCLVQQKDASLLIQKALKQFPKDRFLWYAQAINKGNLRDFEASSSLFASIYAAEPWSLEHVHIYANGLFVLGRYAELAGLANRCCKINRFSPETCCVLGNLWSLMGKHEQAAISFRRALRLDPSMASAWVLVGHEYVEMRNPSAAISAYLRATKANPSDYKAWFGLGQVYDLLGSPAQAADYYRRAAELRPDDARLWAALGMVFEGEEMYEHALDAFSNAVACVPVDTKLYYRLGRLLLLLEVRDEAIQAFYNFLGTRHDLDKIPLEQEDTSFALLEIAKAMLTSTETSDALAILKSISGLPTKEGKEALQLYSKYYGVTEMSEF